MPLPADDPKQRKPDISLAKSKLDWEPKVPLAKGLKYTVDYFQADGLVKVSNVRNLKLWKAA